MNQTQFERALGRLTHRRREVLLKILAGETDCAIAQSLIITEATVRKHIEHICKEFAIVNVFPDERRGKRPELLALFTAYKPELVHPELIAQLNGNVAKTRRVESTNPSVTSPLESLPMETSGFATIHNRDVFILIDQSGSMVRKDADTGTQTRYEYLQEVVEGHISAILSAGGKKGKISGQKICDRVLVDFFSRHDNAANSIIIQDASEVWKLFRENQPKTTTFIAPTLNKCLDTWLRQGKPNNRGAFFLIYTDGQFNDEQQFVDCIAKACANINCSNTVKFFVLGLGQDVEIEQFLHLDYNTNNKMPFDILVFDLVNEVDDIIELLKRQLTDEPQLVFPKWVKQRYPEFVEQVLGAWRREQSALSTGVRSLPGS